MMVDLEVPIIESLEMQGLAFGEDACIGEVPVCLCTIVTRLSSSITSASR